MSRFAPFQRFDVPYCTVNNIPLEATILIPHTIASKSPSNPEKHPVMIRWHGGGFITGHRMYEPWFARWLLELALRNGAIVISLDYRLIPESTGADVLDDVRSFWRWLQMELPALAEGGAA